MKSDECGCPLLAEMMSTGPLLHREAFLFNNDDNNAHRTTHTHTQTAMKRSHIRSSMYGSNRQPSPPRLPPPAPSSVCSVRAQTRRVGVALSRRVTPVKRTTLVISSAALHSLKAQRVVTTQIFVFQRVFARRGDTFLFPGVFKCESQP
jgi:hypothetical protein